MIISTSYPECNLKNINIELFAYQKRMIQYLYDIELSRLEIIYNFLDYFNNSINNVYINHIKLNIIKKINSTTFLNNFNNIIPDSMGNLFNFKDDVYCIRDSVGNGKSYSILGLIKYFKDNYKKKILSVKLLIPLLLLFRLHLYHNGKNILKI